MEADCGPRTEYSATKGAWAKLQASRSDLDASQELLQKSIERERKAQETFDEMQQKLIRLASEKPTIVRRILLGYRNGLADAHWECRPK